jgi:hypothetical protein
MHEFEWPLDPAETLTIRGIVTPPRVPNEKETCTSLVESERKVRDNQPRRSSRLT